MPRLREWGDLGFNVTMFLGRYYSGNRVQAVARAEHHNREQEVRLRDEAERLAARAAARDRGHPWREVQFHRR